MPGKPYLFFEKPKVMSERDVEITAGTMWQVRLKQTHNDITTHCSFQPMQIYQENLSQLFKNFVKNADVRSDVLRWIGDCLVQNRGKFIQ